MSDESYDLLFGILILLIGLLFTFLHNKIIQLQGESNKGDFTLDQRRRKLIASSIVFLIGGIYFVVRSLW